MLKYQDLATVGDVIRGYDFRGCRSAYLQGTVLAKGAIVVDGVYRFDGYTIQVEKDAAEMGRDGDIAYIPFETGLDYDGRVEVVRVEYSAAAECVGV